MYSRMRGGWQGDCKWCPNQGQLVGRAFQLGQSGWELLVAPIKKSQPAPCQGHAIKFIVPYSLWDWQILLLRIKLSLKMRGLEVSNGHKAYVLGQVFMAKQNTLTVISVQSSANYHPIQRFSLCLLRLRLSAIRCQTFMFFLLVDVKLMMQPYLKVMLRSSEALPRP